MKLEHLLLGLIGVHPSTGYDLKKYLDLHGRFLRSRTTMSQVYRSLSRMEDDGWVRHDIDHRPGAQDAKIFRLTAEGGTVLMDWLTGPYIPPSRFQDPEFTVRLTFSAFMTVDQLLSLIETELSARVEQVAVFRDRDRTMRMDPALPYDRQLAVSMVDRLHRMGTEQIDQHIAQLRALRDDILDGRLPERGSAEASHPDTTETTSTRKAH